MIKSLFGSSRSSEPNLLERLKAGIQKTRAGLMEKLEDAVSGRKEIDADVLEELEYALITADIGAKTTAEILERIRQRIDRHMTGDLSELKALIREHLLEILQATERPLPQVAEPPAVIMVVGVNGAGKTTSIGKLDAPPPIGRPQRPAVRRRHVSRRGDRAAGSMGAAHRRGTDPAAARLGSERGRVRRAAGRAGAQNRLRDRRHRRPAAHQNQPDGGARKDAPHRGARDSRPLRTRCCW